MTARQALGFFSRLITPSYGYCLDCGVSWAFAKEHITCYDGGNGCFPLCEKCWSSLSVEQRLPYYVELLFTWDIENRKKWPAIEAAVEAGK